MTKINKKMYIVKAYDVNPESKERIVKVKNKFLLFFVKIWLKLFYDYIVVNIRYI